MAKIGLKKFHKRLAELNEVATILNNSKNPYYKSVGMKKILNLFILKIKKVPDFKYYIPILNDFLNCQYSNFEKRKVFLDVLKNIQSYILDNCDISKYPNVPIFNFKNFRHEYSVQKFKNIKKRKLLQNDSDTEIEQDEELLIYDDTRENYVDPSPKRHCPNSPEHDFNCFDNEYNSENTDTSPIENNEISIGVSSHSIIENNSNINAEPSNSKIMSEIMELYTTIKNNNDILTEIKEFKKNIEINNEIISEIKELKKIITNNNEFLKIFENTMSNNKTEIDKLKLQLQERLNYIKFKYPYGH